MDEHPPHGVDHRPHRDPVRADPVLIELRPEGLEREGEHEAHRPAGEERPLPPEGDGERGHEHAREHPPDRHPGLLDGEDEGRVPGRAVAPEDVGAGGGRDGRARPDHEGGEREEDRPSRPREDEPEPHQHEGRLAHPERPVALDECAGGARGEGGRDVHDGGVDPDEGDAEPGRLRDGGGRDGQHQGRQVGERLLDQHRHDREPQPLRRAGAARRGRSAGREGERPRRGSGGRCPGGRPVRTGGLHVACFRDPGKRGGWG